MEYAIIVVSSFLVGTYQTNWKSIVVYLSLLIGTGSFMEIYRYCIDQLLRFFFFFAQRWEKNDDL